jgi:hypothetical protein
MTKWTTPDDVERTLRRQWDTGRALAAYGEGAAWQPLGVPLRGPTAGELAAELERARSWAATWRRAAGRLGRLEHRRVGGRLVGVNELPARLWVDSYDQLWTALGVREPAEWFATQVEAARADNPRLIEWMLRHPLRVLERRTEWSRLVATVRWIDAYADGSRYLRQVDVPGVDTKFIETHRAVLASLLDAQLDSDRIDFSRPRSDLAARYGLRRRPRYARLRTLDDRRPLAGGFSELSVRLHELAATPPTCEKVYVIENDITYLAFPSVDHAVAVFGGGYAVTMLEQLGWLTDRELIYWGDLDTHGFGILDRLRQRFPHTRSLLMDRRTLLDHENQWVREGTPLVAHLAHLRPEEAELYRDLVEQTFGPAVRLEQERVSYSAITAAVSPHRPG